DRSVIPSRVASVAAWAPAGLPGIEGVWGRPRTRGDPPLGTRRAPDEDAAGAVGDREPPPVAESPDTWREEEVQAGADDADVEAGQRPQTTTQAASADLLEHDLAAWAGHGQQTTVPAEQGPNRATPRLYRRELPGVRAMGDVKNGDDVALVTADLVTADRGQGPPVSPVRQGGVPLRGRPHRRPPWEEAPPNDVHDGTTGAPRRPPHHPAHLASPTTPTHASPPPGVSSIPHRGRAGAWGSRGSTSGCTFPCHDKHPKTVHLTPSDPNY